LVEEQGQGIGEQNEKIKVLFVSTLAVFLEKRGLEAFSLGCSRTSKTHHKLNYHFKIILDVQGRSH
jgi:hypothetical protein